MTETAQLVHGHMRYLYNDDVHVQPPATILTRSATKLRELTQVSNDIQLFSDMLEHGQYEPDDQAQIVHCLKVRLQRAKLLLPFK